MPLLHKQNQESRSVCTVPCLPIDQTDPHPPLRWLVQTK